MSYRQDIPFNHWYIILYIDNAIAKQEENIIIMLKFTYNMRLAYIILMKSRNNITMKTNT